MARVVIMVGKGGRFDFIDGQKLRRDARVLAGNQIRASQNGRAPVAQIASVTDGRGNDDQSRPNLGSRRFTLFGWAARFGAVIIASLRAEIGTVFAVRGTG